MQNSSQTVSKNRISSFIRQHLLLLASLEVMTLGVALSVKSNLGSSVISTIPYVLSIAGKDGMAPQLTIGDYTIMMNFVFVFLQILILRRNFDPGQLFQLLIGFAFGWLIDFNIYLTGAISCNSLWSMVLCQIIGCTVLGIGIAFEVRCGSVTMPGEGITIATSRVTKLPFAKVKMMIDTALVSIAVIACCLFYGHWRWEIIGVGTLFAMVYVGFVVKSINPHLGWFDNILESEASIHLFGLRKHRN